MHFRRSSAVIFPGRPRSLQIIAEFSDGVARATQGGKERRPTALASYAALRGSWLVGCGFAVDVVLVGACLPGIGAHVALNGLYKSFRESLWCFHPLPNISLPSMSAGRAPNSA